MWRAIPLSILAAAALAAAPLPGQSCYPVGVRLAVRDAAGRRMDASRVDSVVVQPRGEHAPREVRVFARPYEPPVLGDTLNTLFFGVSGCRLELGSATVYLGGQAMHLRFDIAMDSEMRRRDSVYLIEAPPFQPGSFRLRWNGGLEAGHPDPVLLRGRWDRVDSR